MTEPTGNEEYAQHLHSAAADGDVSGIENALKGIPNINARNNRGWTALMFAARNGHANAVKCLLKNGADASMINAIGQTALDIAEFWQHQAVILCLKGAEASNSGVPEHQGQQPVRNHFSNSPLNRASEKRHNTTWLTELQTSANATYVVLTELQPLGCLGHSSLNRLKRFRYSESIQKLIDTNATLVFLGIERSGMDLEEESIVADAVSTGVQSTDGHTTLDSKPSNGHTTLDSKTAVGWFAIDATNAEEDLLKELCTDAAPITIPLGLMQMSRSEAAIVGQARSMLAWHDRYRYCPTCGKATQASEAGYKRECVDKECRSNKGVHNTCYPRTDPTVIMAILSPDKKQVLLGRAVRHPPGMWSCLAGFMEPGETVEEACRREVFEESGIEVGHVEYHSSQPWPMPSSLMIGCIGYALNTNIKVDKEELDDARWFNVQDLRQMLTHQHPQKLFCPPEQAIAHQLIKHCVISISKL